MLINPFQFCRSREFNRRLAESRDRLYRMAYAWSHNPALSEDLVQDTLTKALKNVGQLRELDSIDAWLFSILANCWRDAFRRNRELEDIDTVAIAHDTTPERLHSQQEIVTLVRNAVGQLPDGQRQALTLVDLEGFSYNDVAQILQVPIGTVMSRLCRARKMLKTLLLDANAHEFNAVPRIRRVK